MEHKQTKSLIPFDTTFLCGSEIFSLSFSPLNVFQCLQLRNLCTFRMPNKEQKQRQDPNVASTSSSTKKSLQRVNIVN